MPIQARWGFEDHLWGLLGKSTNATFTDVPVRSNFWGIGLGTLVDQATVATKKGTFVAIPVQEGDVISKITHLIGATEGKTGVFSFVALYSGVTGKKEAELLAQSKVAEVAIKPSKPLTETLEKSVTITSTNAPNGYVYAGLVVEATTIETLIGVAVATAGQYEWLKGSPEAFAVTAEQNAKSEAKAKIKIEGEAVANTPIVFLS